MAPEEPVEKESNDNREQHRRPGEHPTQRLPMTWDAWLSGLSVDWLPHPELIP